MKDPKEIRKVLLAIAERVPLREAVYSVAEVCRRNPRTVSYATVGFLLGAIVDNLPLVGILTGGYGKYVGLALGAGEGFVRDRESAQKEEAIACAR